MKDVLYNINDVLDELKKKGIISDEGVIDSYLLCKHAEELFGKSYLKTHNLVLDDDKKEAGMAIGDIILYTDDIGDVYFNWGVRKGPYAKDIFCSFERKTDEKKIKNMLTHYGFTIQQTKKGLWIRGVKE